MFWREPKFGFSSEEIGALLSLLREHGEMFTPAPVCGGSPDPDDEQIAKVRSFIHGIQAEAATT